MSREVLLIRCADYKGLGSMLPGRDDAPLTVTGRTHAHSLSASLSSARISMVGHGSSSRARVTAQIIAYVHDTQPQPIAALDDLDYGNWRGRTLSELESDSQWQTWHADPDNVRWPGNETPMQAGQRALAALGSLPAGDDGLVVLVTHANIIRAALVTVLGCSFSSALRMDIAPASITQLRRKDGAWQVGGVTLRGGYGLVAPTNHCLWPANRDGVGEKWAPGSETRLGL